MTGRVWRGLFLVALMAVSPVAQAAEDPLDVVSFLRSCWEAKDEATCKAMVADFRQAWRLALRGDYEGQRNVAFCLRTGCSGAVQKNQVLSCAWRAIIISSNNPKVNELDVDAFKYDCGQLNDGDKLLAQSQAEYIILRIER